MVTVAFCARVDYAQCELLDKRNDMLFVTFERPAQFSDDIEKPKVGVVLRLRNNSSCDVEIRADSADSFFKPIPKNATPIQFIKREIDYVLPNETFVPQLNYKIPSQRGDINVPGGHVKFDFQLLSGRSILFAVPVADFQRSVNNGRIDIPFEYSSQKERSSYPSVRHVVHFYFGSLPENIRLRKVRNR